MGGTDGRQGTGTACRCRPGGPSSLPGRGTTFVRELRGSEGRADAAAAARLDGHRRPQLVRLLRPVGRALPGRRPRPSRPRARRARRRPVPPRGLRRRRRRPRRRHSASAAVVPVGYSMGGPIAQLLWQRHPHLVDGLVLCATSCHFSGTIRERLLLRPRRRHVGGRRCRPAGLGDDGRRHGVEGNGASGAVGVVGLRGRGPPRLEPDRRGRSGDPRLRLAPVDRIASTVPAAVVVTDDDDVVPVHRQLDLAARLPGRPRAHGRRRTRRVHAAPRALRSRAGRRLPPGHRRRPHPRQRRLTPP